ncbi:MAG: ribonuclease Z [Deltaproteobacteria bacterium]|nr:ribonuclease Z [Deltaproteobacteria bacterium]MBN2686976.1 ribonuclease Z [Deltaproteobacteria bacterium]
MFSATLINDPFDDPGVYIDLRYRREALLFDLGDLHALPPRKILKIQTIFVSHTHMDHFIGLDHLLRICLGRDQHIALFGPPGFIGQVESKLGAYTWNLVENYTNDFILDVTELHERQQSTRRYRCRTAFTPEVMTDEAAYSGTVMDRDDLTVKAVFLDHQTPSLAYSLEEKQHLNIMKNALIDMNLPVGPWLSELKQRILRGDPDTTPVEIRGKHHIEKDAATLPLGVLRERIIKVTEGMKISYIADAVYSDDNAAKIVNLADSSDIMFIEATFLDEDSERAKRKYHLTARQAGKLARRAGAKNLVLFHFSPKYRGREQHIVDEAMAAFRGNENGV